MSDATFRPDPDLGALRCRCGRFVTFGRADHDGRKDMPCATHELPTCREYVQMDMIAYMRWLRGVEPYPV